MRSPWRTFSESALLADPALLRDVALICVADAIVGLSFGAATVAGGLPWWVPVVMSVFVFAGGSQFAAVGVVLAGGSPVAAVATAAVLNTRLLPYGLAVADVVRGPRDAGGANGGQASWRRRARLLAGAHVITDESVAFALAADSPERQRAAFWTCGVALFAAWNLATGLGVLAGSLVRNTAALGVDATFPAVVLALALPALREARTRRASLAGAVVAVGLTPVLPAGLPVLAALAGLGINLRPGRSDRLGSNR
jgi:4-azaleucine resistance transporter AzlC